MRAMRGNTSKEEEANEVKVAWWNARVLAAAGDYDARTKLDWLLAVLDERRPAVAFIFEVLGSIIDVRPLRRRLAKQGYSMYLQPGESVGRRDGVLVVVDNKRARIRKAWRVAERALAVQVAFRGETRDAEHPPRGWRHPAKRAAADRATSRAVCERWYVGRADLGRVSYGSWLIEREVGAERASGCNRGV